jgi:dolichol kinase
MKTFPGKGALFFIAGCLLVLKLFEPNIALASIAILTFIDSVPPLVKISKIKRKRLIGTIAGGVLTFIAASFFVPLLLAAFGTIIGAISEAILLKSDKYGVDDNLIVPLVSGTLMMLFSGIII